MRKWIENMRKAIGGGIHKVGRGVGRASTPTNAIAALAVVGLLGTALAVDARLRSAPVAASGTRSAAGGTVTESGDDGRPTLRIRLDLVTYARVRGGYQPHPEPTPPPPPLPWPISPPSLASPSRSAHAGGSAGVVTMVMPNPAPEKGPDTPHGGHIKGGWITIDGHFPQNGASNGLNDDGRQRLRVSHPNAALNRSTSGGGSSATPNVGRVTNPRDADKKVAWDEWDARHSSGVDFWWPRLEPLKEWTDRPTHSASGGRWSATPNVGKVTNSRDADQKVAWDEWDARQSSRDFWDFWCPIEPVIQLDCHTLRPAMQPRNNRPTRGPSGVCGIAQIDNEPDLIVRNLAGRRGLRGVMVVCRDPRIEEEVTPPAGQAALAPTVPSRTSVGVPSVPAQPKPQPGITQQARPGIPSGQGLPTTVAPQVPPVPQPPAAGLQAPGPASTVPPAPQPPPPMPHEPSVPPPPAK